MKPVDKAPGGGSGGGKNEKNGGKSNCALCGKPVVKRFRPFCSKHCADVDLGRWLGEEYAVPGVEGDAGEFPDSEE